MSRRADEAGMAAPVVVMLAGLLVVLALTGGALGRLLVDQRRASAAADLAALAGAGAVQRGQAACPAAALIARDNDAVLVSCRVGGEQVVVRASVRETGLVARLLGSVGRSVSVEAEARAGPVP